MAKVVNHDKPRSDFRYERKFVISGVQPQDVESRIRFHPHLFSEIYQKRIINNIYLDTPNLDHYFDNVKGISNRRKVRIRWYGDLFGEIAGPVLEFKIKAGFVGTKRFYRLPPLVLDDSFSIETLRQLFLDSELPEEVQHELKFLDPQVINSYERKYFLSDDKAFRLTLDSGISYVDVSRWNHGFTNQVRDDYNLILEMKYSVGDDQLAGMITNHFEFPLTKNSKYVKGIDQFRTSLAV